MEFISTQHGGEKEQSLPFVKSHQCRFVPRDAVPYLQTNSSFLAIDATFKTNTNDYHLVQIIGVALTLQTIPLAFALMAQETTDQYTFVLSEQLKLLPATPKVVVTDKDAALRSATSRLFQNTHGILCTWHATQSVHTKAKALYPEKEAAQCRIQRFG
ncbi:putative MULE transposase domain containing protein [Blattamonas nauphoetae]|uniref:MULE transposase domain containing protein n=1 Tax=Blattamonas nauphoetae TaxID=2049346 RepID=A0ABQ9XHM3_9EUKA|nr:putative MULE transposase domain containing protein [Blattamonas nauphoetae]